MADVTEDTLWMLYTKPYFAATPARLRNERWGHHVWICITAEERQQAREQADRAVEEYSGGPRAFWEKLAGPWRKVAMQGVGVFVAPAK